ncbi:MAG TPA: arginine deiminase-related protein [Holophagaceae bacterium]|nr:arginine deiminase-related protein [Holophagaceae bacterium]
MQTTSHVLMVRPTRFDANPETMGSNAFQRSPAPGLDPQAQALAEFDGYVAALEAAGVAVLVVQDTPAPPTPDSIFPNNWVSFHADGTVILYPMEAPNRRLERHPSILAAVAERFEIRRTLDLSPLETTGRYLEGTGSMVLDREHRLAYLCRSSRSHPEAVQAFCDLMGFTAVWFDATDEAGTPIYHTNVMMALGRTLAVICLEAIADPAQRAALLHHFQATGKVVLPISRAQMNAFAGNMIELQGWNGHPVFAMSRRAWHSLTEAQRDLILAHAQPVVAPIDTIEHCGGGGTRCMVAEIHLPLQAEDASLRVG